MVLSKNGLQHPGGSNCNSSGENRLHVPIYNGSSESPLNIIGESQVNLVKSKKIMWNPWKSREIQKKSREIKKNHGKSKKIMWNARIILWTLRKPCEIHENNVESINHVNPKKNHVKSMKIMWNPWKQCESQEKSSESFEFWVNSHLSAWRH